MSATEDHASAIAAALRDLRVAAGYTLEQMALTCGLTTNELDALETGMDTDSAKLERVAASLGLTREALIPTK